jgi:hypothetical protein
LWGRLSGNCEGAIPAHSKCLKRMAGTTGLSRPPLFGTDSANFLEARFWITSGWLTNRG